MKKLYKFFKINALAFVLLTLVNVIDNNGKSTMIVLWLLSLAVYVVGETLLHVLFKPKDKQYTKTIEIISYFISFSIIVISATALGFL